MNEAPFPADGAVEAAGAEPAVAASERSYDLSLRLLTWLVVVALVGSVTLLVYRWLEPLSGEGGNRVTVSQPVARPAPAPEAAGPAKRDEVLMEPGHVFRCEEEGRVTFSDRTCPGAEAAGGGH